MIHHLKRVVGWVGAWLSSIAGEETKVSRGLTLDAHPLTTQVTLVLDRPRRLRFTMLEAAEFRKRTGVSVWTGEGTPDGQGLDLLALEEDHLLELLVVAASADDPGVTRDQLAPHLAGESLMEVVAALMVLISDFLPDAPAGDEEELLSNPLVASALLRLTKPDTGRSPRSPWAFLTGSSGPSPRA